MRKTRARGVLWGVLMVAMLSGCATLTPQQRAAWHDVGVGLRQLGAASDVARQQDELRRLQQQIFALQGQQALHQAMQSPFVFSR